MTGSILAHTLNTKCKTLHRIFRGEENNRTNASRADLCAGVQTQIPSITKCEHMYTSL
jgi:hypothetical protein